jgi:predicted protein tyrosine phosphatase
MKNHKTNILVVCSKNLKRSPTAEEMYKNDQRCNVRAVGTSPKAERKISFADLSWADLVLCMEQKHKRMIEQQFGKNNLPELQVLDIEDKYEFMDPELVDMLRREVEAIFAN